VKGRTRFLSSLKTSVVQEAALITPTHTTPVEPGMVIMSAPSGARVRRESPRKSSSAYSLIDIYAYMQMHSPMAASGVHVLRGAHFSPQQAGDADGGGVLAKGIKRAWCQRR
jgi:hypothetical protein